MAKQTINIGASPNDGTGTPLRTAFDYTNQNFTELYTATGPSGNNIVVPGSATITGDLTVDTSTLKVDSANNRVGIGTASPAATAEVNGGNLYINGNAGAYGLYSFYDRANLANVFSLIRHNGDSGGTQIYNINSSVDRSFNFYSGTTLGGASLLMTLNATGLGIGVSPVTALSFPIGSTRVVAQSATTNHAAGNVGTLKFGISDGGGDYSGLHVVNSHNGTYSSQDLLFFTGEGGISTCTERMRITRSGNVGIGVTPSAWNSSYRALQIGATGALWQSASGFTFLSDNAFVNSGASNTYITTAAASFYRQNAGVHTWWNAPSGTAGNAITFTQAMTLDASGNLLVGTTSAAGGRLDVQTATGNCTVRFKSNAAGSNVVFAQDYVDSFCQTVLRKSGTDLWSTGVINDATATPRFSVVNASSVGVYVTYGGTSWTATSDERLKDIIEPISNAVAKVGSLRSVIGKFKTDSESTRRSFLIAQDVQAVLPEAVDASNPDRLGVAYSEVIPLLVAAIKELTARVQTLETR